MQDLPIRYEKYLWCYGFTLQDSFSDLLEVRGFRYSLCTHWQTRRHLVILLKNCIICVGIIDFPFCVFCYKHNSQFLPRVYNKFDVDLLVANENVSLVISRQILSEFCGQLGDLPDAVSKEVAHYTLEKVQPRVVSFEEQVRTFFFLLSLWNFAVIYSLQSRHICLKCMKVQKI